jgi:hypothetical protein
MNVFESRVDRLKKRLRQERRAFKRKFFVGIASVLAVIFTSTGIFAAEASLTTNPASQKTVVSQQPVETTGQQQAASTSQQQTANAEQQQAKHTLSLSPKDNLMDINTEQQLEVKFDGKRVPAKDCTFTSSNPFAATVNSKGIVLAKAGGRATVEVAYKGIKAQAKIDVKAWNLLLITREKEEPTRTFINGDYEILVVGDDGNCSSQFANLINTYNKAVNKDAWVRIGNKYYIVVHVGSNASGQNLVNILDHAVSNRYGVQINENVHITTVGLDPAKVTSIINTGFNVTPDKLNSYDARVRVDSIDNNGVSSNILDQKFHYRDVQEQNAFGIVGRDGWVALTVSDGTDLMVGKRYQWDLAPRLHIAADPWVEARMGDWSNYQFYLVGSLKYDLIKTDEVTLGLKQPFFAINYNHNYRAWLHPSGNLDPYVQVKAGNFLGGMLSLNWERLRLKGHDFGKYTENRFQLMWQRKW